MFLHSSSTHLVSTGKSASTDLVCIRSLRTQEGHCGLLTLRRSHSFNAQSLFQQGRQLENALTQKKIDQAQICYHHIFLYMYSRVEQRKLRMAGQKFVEPSEALSKRGENRHWIERHCE